MTRSMMFTKYSCLSRELYQDYHPEDMMKQAEEIWESYFMGADPEEHSYLWNSLSHEMEKEAGIASMLARV